MIKQLLRLKMIIIIPIVYFIWMITPLKTEAISPPPILMAALGDSLTAATLANAPLKIITSPMLSPLGWPFLNDVIRAWFDRVSSEESIIANKQKLSWVSGEDIPSHFHLLQKHLQQIGEIYPLEVRNFAVPRDTSKNLDSQVQKLLQTMKSGKYSQLLYITLMIGSNDACSKETLSGTPDATMRENLRKALEKISTIRQQEPIHILIVGIPKITDLGDKNIRTIRHPFGGNCEYIRNEVLHFCDSLLTWKTPEELQEKIAVIDKKNQILEETAIEASQKFPNLQIKFTKGLERLLITPDVLALDCFHVDKFGQTQISQELWGEQPWF